ncbi:MAG: hypothetical protein AAF447_25195, partial [Myxococcota bacterium]
MLNNIAATGIASPSSRFRPNMLGGSAASPLGQGGGAMRSRVEAELSKITNEEGQSLLDMKGEIESAVKSTLAEGGGRAEVKDALFETLEENGFDPSEVRSALENAGGGRPPPRGLARRGRDALEKGHAQGLCGLAVRGGEPPHQQGHRHDQKGKGRSERQHQDARSGRRWLLIHASA